MFRKLLSLDEAKEVFKRNFLPKPVGVESVPLSEVGNRVLAEDIVAPLDIPPFTRSMVDGYAVRAVDTFHAEENEPATLEFCGYIAIGELPTVTVKNHTTAEIVTGAPLPKGADAVVMLEYAVRQDNTVLIHRPVSAGEKVMTAGSDIQKGETILEKGQISHSREIGTLAALGITEVVMYKRPKVAVISTGAEIVDLGEPLLPGKIYDINTFTLSAAIRECGGEPTSVGIIPDEMSQLKRALKKTLTMMDMVVTSGGVSVGPKDLIPQVLNTLGKPGIIISGIAVKPGKPTTVAVIDGKPVFSLPGNPTSALLMFYQLVRPQIRCMTGAYEKAPPIVKAVAEKRMFAEKGRRTFVMVKLTGDKNGQLIASPAALGLSGAITTLAKADGFVEISEDQQFIDAGDEASVCLFNPEINREGRKIGVSSSFTRNDPA
ncbi:MAG: molybdopterin molybdenumtransferase MoeA [Candidatus Bathyarchaeota archaeon]|nr:MAG: molybdopterin molybdenumtransferase MoeA [Candidatus Bathyarchaeota archaeon]